MAARPGADPSPSAQGADELWLPGALLSEYTDAWTGLLGKERGDPLPMSATGTGRGKGVSGVTSMPGICHVSFKPQNKPVK